MAETNGIPTRPTSFWLDEETQSILIKLSNQTGMSRSAIVREAIRLMDADPSQAKIRKLVKDLSKAVGT